MFLSHFRLRLCFDCRISDSDFVLIMPFPTQTLFWLCHFRLRLCFDCRISDSDFIFIFPFQTQSLLCAFRIGNWNPHNYVTRYKKTTNQPATLIVGIALSILPDIYTYIRTYIHTCCLLLRNRGRKILQHSTHRGHRSCLSTRILDFIEKQRVEFFKNRSNVVSTSGRNELWTWSLSLACIHSLSLSLCV
jgi:hypothetical protein